MESDYKTIKDAVIKLAAKTADLSKMKQFHDTILNDTETIIYITGLEDNGDWQRDDIIWMNEHATKQFGNKIGGKCYEVFQGLHDTCTFCTNPQLLENPGKPIKWVLYNQTVQRLYHIVDVMVVVQEKRFRIEVAQDITDQAKEIVTLYNKYIDG